MPLTPQQLEARKSGIGGSDVAAIAGISPWKTAHDIYLIKTTGNGGNDDMDGKDHIIFGNLQEPVIRKEFERRNGVVVHVTDEVFRHPTKPYLLANVDGELSGGRIGLEIKTVSEYSAGEWGEENTDQIPQYYLTQVLHYMNVRGWEGCYVAALIGGNKYRQYYVKRDEEAIKAIEELCDDFWINHVQAGVPPKLTLLELKDAWKETTGKAIDAPEQVADQCEQLRQLKKEIEALEGKKSSLERDIKAFMADNDEIRIDGKKLATWKFNKPSRRFSEEAVKKAAPEIYEQCFVEVPGPRVFRLA